MFRTHTHDAPRDPDEPIAIVGMAGRFPGAADLESFWRLLMARGDAIRPVPAERWDAIAALDPEDAVPRAGGFLDGVDEFDPTFFGISPREAEDIDPQHRLMLEVTWQALEDAAQPAAALRGSRTGVYIGASWHDYEILRTQRGASATQHSGPGNALDMIAARVSYFLGLTGPSLAVETGCSSSLVALHLACQALRCGEIDGALVGGVNLILAPDVSVALTRFGGLSPDGRCKAFAASADGFVRGEGAIAVYVKPLARARADGDRIHAVIAGTAVNNDGGGDSLVTPSPAGQEALLTRAYAAARIPADAVAYVEAHGTGTRIGDPIEAGGLGRVLGQRRTAAAGPLAIGSVKTNIGHLEAAAGLAGLVKTVLALEHRVVPANLHGEVLNPAIPFDALNLHVVRAPLALPAHGPLYAGVNSFGWGGTNAHAILCNAPEEASSAPTAPSTWAPIVVPLSAHSDEALRQRAIDVQAVVATGDAPAEALAATLACKRDSFPRRVAFVVETAAELEARLAAFAANPDGEHAGVVRGAARPRGRTAFVFAGQGSQWLDMGRALFATSPTFAAVIRHCAAALAPHVDWDLVACLTGQAGPAWLTRVDMLQPVLWATSVALAALWRETGVEPDVVVGHSQGEIAAATVAGILSYEDAARVVARRSQIVRRKSGHGLMLAVDLDAAAARAALAGFDGQISLAAHNGPISCVLSGDSDAVTTLQELLEADPLRSAPATSTEAFYAGCAARGLCYGPAFRGVVQVFADGDQALGEVRLPAACRAGARPHGLHPALWDAALQVCLALCPGDRTVVPTAVARVAILQDLAQPVAALWSHVVRRDETRFDVVIFDLDEQPVMALEGVTLTALIAPTAPGIDRIHRLCFQDAAPAPATAPDGAWIVCGDADGAGALIEALGRDRARLVEPVCRDEDPQATSWLGALRAGRAPAGVVFVAPSAAAGLAAQRRGCSR